MILQTSSHNNVDMRDLAFRIEARKQHWRRRRVQWQGRILQLPNEIRARISFYLRVAYYRMVRANGVRRFIRQQRARPAFQQRVREKTRFRILQAKLSQKYPGVAGESAANPIVRED